jgi:hypothetical protein
LRVSFQSVVPIFGATYARLGGISGEYGLKLGAFSGKKFQGVSNWDGKLSRHLAVRIGSRQGKPCNERIRIWNRSERKSNSLHLRVKGNPHSVSTKLLDLIANKRVNRRGVFPFRFRGSCRLEPCFDGEVAPEIVQSAGGFDEGVLKARLEVAIYESESIEN